MSWRDRQWAARHPDEPEYKDKASPREREIPREMEGPFPSPVRDDAAYEKGTSDFGSSYASCVALADMVRDKVGEYLAEHEIRSLQEAGGFVEMLHKLVIAAHNARHLDSGAPPKEEDDDEIDADGE